MRARKQALWGAMAVLLGPLAARAQAQPAAATPPAATQPPAAAPAPPATAAAAEDPERDLLTPDPARVAVRVESSRAGPFALGVAAAMPRSESPVSFTAEPAAVLCRTPCTLYLRPGVRRLYGDAGSDFTWMTDLRLRAGEPTQLRFRGHLLGFSALGGVGFVGGIAGGIGLVALAVVSAFIATPRPEPWFYVLCGVGAAAGAGLAVGGFKLLEYAAPRLESRAPWTPPTLQLSGGVGALSAGAGGWLALRF